jgi:hypothetical protein
MQRPLKTTDLVWLAWLPIAVFLTWPGLKWEIGILTVRGHIITAPSFNACGFSVAGARHSSISYFVLDPPPGWAQSYADASFRVLCRQQ